MTDKIEIGEYVRTNKGYIAKFKKYLENTGTYMFDNVIQDIDDVKYKYISENELKKVMIKQSKNIIDLIEIGDYVNGYRVVEVMEDLETGKIHLEMTSDYTNELIGDCTIYNDDIKSILTKENLKNNSYKVVE